MSEYSLTLYIPLFNEEDGIKYLYDEINKYEFAKNIKVSIED